MLSVNLKTCQRIGSKHTSKIETSRITQEALGFRPLGRRRPGQPKERWKVHELEKEKGFETGN